MVCLLAARASIIKTEEKQTTKRQNLGGRTPLSAADHIRGLIQKTLSEELPHTTTTLGRT